MSLEFTLLGLLRRKPRTGYDLSKIVAKTTNFYWTATRTQVYQSLKRMANKGWITPETIWQTGKPSKQMYHIEEVGEEAFLEWMQSSPDEPVLKEPFLVQMYFLDSLSKQEIIEKINAMKKLHEASLKEYQEYGDTIIDPKRSDKENLARSLPWMAGILFEEMWIKWCNEAVKQVEKLAE